MSERTTSPQWPSTMWLATAALQLPSAEVGKPEKLHVQPGWQLQNSYPLPRRRQAVVVSVVVTASPCLGQAGQGLGAHEEHGACRHEGNRGGLRCSFAR